MTAFYFSASEFKDVLRNPAAIKSEENLSVVSSSAR